MVVFITLSANKNCAHIHGVPEFLNPPVSSDFGHNFESNFVAGAGPYLQWKLLIVHIILNPYARAWVSEWATNLMYEKNLNEGATPLLITCLLVLIQYLFLIQTMSPNSQLIFLPSAKRGLRKNQPRRNLSIILHHCVNKFPSLAIIVP